MVLNSINGRHCKEGIWKSMKWKWNGNGNGIEMETLAW